MRRAAPWLLLLAVLAGAASWAVFREIHEWETATNLPGGGAAEEDAAAGAETDAMVRVPQATRWEPEPARLVGTGDAVRVFVTDEAGIPVPAAELRVTRSYFLRDLLLRTGVADGEAAFRCPTVFGSVLLDVRHPRAADGTSLNLLRGEMRVGLKPGAEVRVVLKRGWEITGTVLRDVGGPAVGLRVGACGPTWTGQPYAVATTDEGGHFVFRGLRPDSTVHVLRGSGWMSPGEARSVRGESHLDLAVTQVHDVVVRVVGPSGAPLPGAVVVARSSRLGHRSVRYGPTTPPGTYIVRDVPLDETLSISVDPTALRPPLPEVRANLEPGDEEVTVRVPPAAYIEGRVTYADGQPILHVSVGASSELGPGTRADDHTDADGRFRIGPVAPGEYRVACRFRERGDGRVPPAVQASAPCHGVSFVCERPAVLHARVINGGGATLRASWAGEGEASHSVDVGPDGVIRVGAVQRFPGLLWVYEVGAARAALVEIPELSESWLDVRLEEAETIRGTVTVRRWRARYFVTLYRGDRVLERHLPVSPDGRFETPPVPNGEYRLRVWPPFSRLPPFVTARAGARAVVVPSGEGE